MMATFEDVWISIGQSTSSEPNAPYRSVDSPDYLTTTPFPGCSTLDDLFNRAVELYTNSKCLGTRQLISEEDEKQPNGKIFRKAVFGNYEWLTYGEVNVAVKNLAGGLLALDSSVSTGRPNVCIFAETRAEWVISVFSCFKSNLPAVTLYPTLGDDALIHGINETKTHILITSSDLLEKFKKLLPRMTSVRHVVYIPGVKDKPMKLDNAEQMSLHTFTDVQQLGIQRPLNESALRKRPTSDDVAIIMYTSGSTGMPKGVMITNGNLLSGMSGQCQRVPGLGPRDTYVGYLPLAHVLELSAEVSCFTHGVKIGFSSPTTLSDQSTRIKKGSRGDVNVLKPTLMTAVPLIMDRLYKAVHDKVNESSKFQQELFKFFYKYKWDRFETGYSTPLIDRFVFKKIRKLLGGRTRMMLSGGAPLSDDTQRFMNICFCCPIGQGYGLTETCGAGTIQEVTDRSTGRVGAPLQCNEVMLVDWEEGGYRSSDQPCPRGEVWIGGGNVALGYYNDPEKTAEDFHEVDGQRWFATGDIGQFEADGCLRIIDRRKDLVKLQAGEYVSLAKVETTLKLCPLVDNVCLYADSSRMFTVCLVVPNQKHLETVARSLGIEQADWHHLCNNIDIERAVLKALQEQGTKGKLEKFEVPERIKLVSEVWTPDTGLVTEAFKLRRKNIESLYHKEILRMYA